ncbi:L,D-transpeptidase [Nakamurella antarctica]|uniref:L,D-transpeptidase n=1 Tax=Nakamurella antarctica TaxID=1902245 RepID=UPI001EEFEC24|nr:Ig-like domain-containing protein [Nakamurella antarctica]
MTMTNPNGIAVEGVLAADSLSWKSTTPLGYGKTYAIAAVAVDAGGVQVPQAYSFSTLTPRNKALTTAFPTDGMTVGVGQPIALFFDEGIADKAGVEKLISITSAPANVVGAFYWMSDRQVNWRPQEYWPAGTAVEVAVTTYGRDLGNGIYGQADKKFSFTIGQSKIATVDNNTHMMTVSVDGAVVKEMPVSLGTNKYPTYNGVHVVAEAYDKKIMDSSTWGLVGAGAYRTEVLYATRISSSGEFVHAAPWSVWAQGSENVSHGCVNVSTENALWFYENFGFGDIVDIRNTVGPPLQVWDGYGDWNVPWETYSQGGFRS